MVDESTSFWQWLGTTTTTTTTATTTLAFLHVLLVGTMDSLVQWLGLEISRAQSRVFCLWCQFRPGLYIKVFHVGIRTESQSPRGCDGLCSPVVAALSTQPWFIIIVVVIIVHARGTVGDGGFLGL